jgi:2-polyprenyl-6-methoxyphenol hydroxylase-like FAD-dependent oxidoreductase
MDDDVVIAGAVPVGLLLACELRLADVSVLVFEKLADPNLPIKAVQLEAESSTSRRWRSFTDVACFLR